MGADSNELKFHICVPWDTYVLRTPKPHHGEWMETFDLTFLSYVNDALEKALPEELVKSLKEEGSLKAGSIRVEVDVEELDLEEIDYEKLKLKKISFVLEEQVSAMKDFKGKRGLDLEGSIIWVDMEEVDLEEVDYEGLKQKISLVLKERIITMKDLKEQRARELHPRAIARKELREKCSRMFTEFQEKMVTNTC
ncbi:uncharacterized protein LOC126727566 isoform X3 [Quercus robur]|uniref:uncharacterized protein LOC126727566 isoform X3 n=1 Tax=Quercus robur TaxID=38942 RepID=UPI00216233E0|nr:uncharacterized protein LOC126727566 isoform X3 [Quercus robur]